MVNRDISWHLTEASRLIDIAKLGCGAAPNAKKLLDKVLFEHLPAIRTYINDRKWEQAINKVDNDRDTYTG